MTTRLFVQCATVQGEKHLSLSIPLQALSEGGRRALSNRVAFSNWWGNQAFVLLCLTEARTRLPCLAVKSRAGGEWAPCPCCFYFVSSNNNAIIRENEITLLNLLCPASKKVADLIDVLGEELLV